jgi:methyl-accepting chemotaxis protein
VIELDLEGFVIKVNQTYCDMLGYQEQDLLEQHVSMVLDPTFANSSAYKELWDKLKNGSTDSGQYKRIGKGGKEVWIQASYNPIRDVNGKITKIVNYTIDITAEKLTASENASQLAAISKAQGVIEFDMTGKIIAVNDNFAVVTGYSKDEIVGKHHSMFVDAAYKSSPEYKAFWDKLNLGESDAGQYRRITKGGKEVWLQASYNPILDLNGKPYKVVKYATDITEQVNSVKALELAVEETQGIIEGAKTGDLSSRVSLEGKTGAIASLCDGVNALMDKMTEVIAQVREAGETINTAATEIATGNNDLSARTEQQASSLEETASSMEELASTVKQNAENAKQANQLAAAASGVAVKGGEVVGNVVTTMADINTSARKIEDIISVIDGIAFQTNILALNAAVEAARAGEQGRGFAVVADEVRNLAQRSASAAKEIKGLITDSVAKTTEGTKLVEDAGNTMQEIVTSVQRVTDIMGEISAASSEQSAGIDQVNNAITSMDEVTQQNAALVEEAAAAAESLVEQAASLMDTVGAFRLAGGNQYNGQSRTSKPAPSYSSNSERRSNNSSMRASTPVAKPASKPAARIIAKTGTDDGEWEEF